MTRQPSWVMIGDAGIFAPLCFATWYGLKHAGQMSTATRTAQSRLAWLEVRR